MEVVGLVSDRARALVKLGKADYLGVASMPDLFHFMQDLGQVAGLQIGRKRKQAQKNLAAAGQTDKEGQQQVFKQVDEIYQSYREEVRGINKTVHPLNGQDEWTQQGEVEKSLTHSFTAITRLAKGLDINVALEKASKVLAQISPIALGIQTWIEMAKTRIDEWVEHEVISGTEKLFLTYCLLPLAYWQIQLQKTQPKARNKDLRNDYKQRLEQAQYRLETHDLSGQIPDHRQNELFIMAHQLAISFQRASSQTEGRNGYLSFINHGHKGIPEQSYP